MIAKTEGWVGYYVSTIPQFFPISRVISLGYIMTATIYSKDNCPYCVKAKHLFEKHGISYEEISAVDYRDQLFERVEQATGQSPKTVPQIFLDGSYVGGHDQLVILLQERENAVRQD